MHAQLWIDHRQLVDAHLAGADGVEAGAAIPLRIGFVLGLRGHLVAREVLAREVLAQGALAHDFPTLAYALDGNLQVGRVANISRIDLRRISGVGAVQRDAAPAARPQEIGIERATRAGWHRWHAALHTPTPRRRSAPAPRRTRHPRPAKNEIAGPAWARCRLNTKRPRLRRCSRSPAPCRTVCTPVRRAASCVFSRTCPGCTGH